MRFPNRSAFIILLLVAIPKRAYPQLFFTEGYAVLVSGDTLRGDIRERSNQLLELRTKPDQTVHSYTPEQLISYQSEGINRVAVHLTEGDRKTAYFMREQINGYVGLYSLFKPEDRLTYAMRLPGKTFIPLRGNLTLLLLTTHLTECADPTFMRLLNAQSSFVSGAQLARLINTYNACVHPDQSIKRSKKPFRYEAGISVGAVKNSWEYLDENTRNNAYWNPNGVYSSTYTAAVGGFFTFIPRKRLSATVEVLFTHYKGTRLIYLNDPLDPTGAASRNRLYSFAESYCAMPLTARYVFSNGVIRWYLKGGVVPTLGMTVTGSFSGDLSATIVSDVDIPMRAGLGIGYLAGLGADIPVGRKRHAYIEVRTMPHLVRNGIVQVANSRSLQIMVSVPLVEH